MTAGRAVRITQSLGHHGVKLRDADVRVFLRCTPELGETGAAEAEHITLPRMGQHKGAASEHLIVGMRTDNQEAVPLPERRGPQHMHVDSILCNHTASVCTQGVLLSAFIDCPVRNP